ncbi:neutral and basic amino acid transport protein rBAT isoform X1 [Etheostoma spectabile]|uniref:neutral and basic amino acid transport protein rBAT isoform X1 n=1 Tax=Etheostoma spectabile TaxID=54343 RepID=UPI0013AECF6B|nr:neutral and basic amino acid transport protein rBAT isoform X1 [Etheostoma spectabile]
MSLKKGPGGMELGECTRNPGYQNVEGDGSAAETINVDPGEKHDSSALKLDPDAVEEYTQIKPYAGMPKEVLLQYSSLARYRVPREILFWLTVACTLVLVALTITVIALSPRCLQWWQASPVYQVYPRSFKDSNGDGVGDLKGIQEQLDHFLYLNIKSVWLSPFYRSPMKDFGYDVEDFRDIDPLFGTMQDFEELLAEMHNKGLKLIMDFIPNHTSDRHRWFNLSRTRDPHYKDYYVWTDCNATGPKPNNWVSVFGNSSWTYDDVRGQCYLHQFLKEQPDLNFRNPNVYKDMTDIIHFWLEKGVDGFRMDAVKHMLEATHLRDEPQVDPSKPAESIQTEFDLHHDYTYTQLGLHDMLRGWRAVLDVYSREPGKYRFMVIESYDYQELEKTMMYYGTPLVRESDFPFNFYLLYLPQNTSGLWVKDLVHLWMANMPKGKWPNWVVSQESHFIHPISFTFFTINFHNCTPSIHPTFFLPNLSCSPVHPLLYFYYLHCYQVGNHDKPRIASSAGQTYTRVINMLLLTLPGTPTTYYGEELGMENINVTDSQIQDPAGKYNASASRDPGRSPMQWNGDMNAGFNIKTNITWLPVHPDYRSVNVEVQMKDEGSVLAQYRFLNTLRQSELPLHRGWFCYVHADASVFSYLRELDGLDRAFLIVLNFGKESATTDLSSIRELPDQLKVLMSTNQINNGKVLQKSRILTEAAEGLVIQYSTHTRFNPNHPEQCYVSEKACYLSAIDILYKC